MILISQQQKGNATPFNRQLNKVKNKTNTTQSEQSQYMIRKS